MGRQRGKKMTNRINGAGKEPEPKTPKKTPATQEAWIAAQLHQERERVKTMRNTLVEKDRVIVEKDRQILVLRSKLLDADAKAADAANASTDAANGQLRQEHGLELARTLHRDEKTGEVFWVETPSE